MVITLTARKTGRTARKKEHNCEKNGTNCEEKRELMRGKKNVKTRKTEQKRTFREKTFQFDGSTRFVLLKRGKRNDFKGFC